MPRTIRDEKLETRAARARLAPQPKAYWKTLEPGRLHLGYRRRRKDAPGIWLARRYIGGERYRVAPLGVADDFDDGAMSFAEAQRAAYAATDMLKAKTTMTVGEAVEEYITWLKAHRATGKDAEQRARKLILPQLGNVRLSDLTTAKLVRWRDALAEMPALLRSRPGSKQNYKAAPSTPEARRARRATVNRTWTILRAALTKAFVAGHVGDDTAWRRVKPFGKVNAARPGFLTVEESARLIHAASDEFRPMIHAALLTGSRYSELAAMRVQDYGRGKAHIARSKSGRPRDVVLSEEGITLFDSLTVGRPRDALIFVRADGFGWAHARQARAMREACFGARIIPAVGFHQLRHTWASLSVMAGMPLPVVARNLGHSSIAMVEKHYSHLSESYIDQAVRAAAPRYGVESPPSNVRPLRTKSSTSSES